MNSSKFLIVDDDPRNMELILKYLSDQPAEVLYAPDGKRAVELAKLEKPDIIFMDWEMPVLNGVEALKILKSDSETSSIPIIINSGIRINPKDLEIALETGAVDFLSKPFEPIEFNARVRANLRLKHQHDTITSLLQENLQRKERELTKLTIQEHEKSTLISEMLAELEKLKPFASPSLLTRLGQLQREMKTKLNLTKSWEKFTVHFEDVHPDFFKDLRAKHPSLSQSDERLCAYLRIHLDNKEIAHLSNVESASVRKALMRLKKKLELPQEANLREYIVAL